ncbi:DUF92 domain-containing protein, partial [bacterium]
MSTRSTTTSPRSPERPWRASVPSRRRRRASWVCTSTSWPASTRLRGSSRRWRRRYRCDRGVSTLSLAPLTTYDWGALFALLVAFAAWRLRWLRFDGALAAFAVGTAVFGSGTWPFALLLLLFFASGTLLGKLPRAMHAPVLVDVGKGGARDGAQVLANGAVAAVCALAAHGAAHAHG